MKKKWLPISEAAKVLKVSERTLYTRIKAGEMKSKLEHGKRFVQVKTPREKSDANSANPAENLETSDETAEIPETVQRLLDEKDARIQQLDGQIENLTRQNDHLTQIVAMGQKNIASLSDQLDTSRALIEDMRNRQPFWRRIFKRA